MMSDSKAEELRIRISNYRRTRQTSVGQLRAWCDTLIRDAEDELRRAGEEETNEPQYETASASAQGSYPLV